MQPIVIINGQLESEIVNQDSLQKYFCGLFNPIEAYSISKEILQGQNPEKTCKGPKIKINI